MKKKIAILGSTGSIGKTLLKIIENDKKNFDVVLLTANTDHKTLLKQAKKFNVQNLIINDLKSYKLLKNKIKKSKIKIFNSFNSINKILNKKIDYVMSSIVGIQGLDPTYRIIKFTKNIAIANKESIICGWGLINNELKKNKTNFIPVDSEHFSIWYGLQNLNYKNIEKIFLTASGGPFYKVPLNKFKNITIKNALQHPSWRMGKKISIDSATMINKVYEVIEAKNIFNISYKNIKILIHPKSYIHAMLKFNNGLIKIIAHDTTMKVPIFNTLFFGSNFKFKTNNIDLNTLNNLNFEKVNLSRYPMVKILKLLPKKHSLFETVIVSANDTFVNLFLQKKISFLDINKELFKILKLNEFSKYKNIKPKKLNDIINLNKYVSTNIRKKYIIDK
tara:strand:- start:3194 stop:4366 length:1173 start_codon:yes stop_codon:yes gene_type:complete